MRAYMAAGAESVLLPHAFGDLVAHRDQGQPGLDAMIAKAYRAGGERPGAFGLSLKFDLGRWGLQPRYQCCQ